MFVLSNITSRRFSPQKQNFSTMPPLMMSQGPIYERSFSDFINRKNPDNREQLNQNNIQTPSETELKCHKEPLKIPVLTSTTCNNYRKKNKRKRRTRKRKNQQPNPTKMESETSSDDEITSPPISQRQRNLSTESDDSFVVFFDHSDQDLSVSSPETDDSDTEEEVVEEITVRATKVRFAAGPELAEVHHMIKWSYAYQAARKGPWEEHARDRTRFRDRIRRMEPIFDNVLSTEHRAKIFEQRFQ